MWPLAILAVPAPDFTGPFQVCVLGPHPASVDSSEVWLQGASQEPGLCGKEYGGIQ